MAPSRSYEWDERKADINLRAHGIAFTTAARVFADPFMRSRIDDRENYGEERWQAFGDVGGRILVVAYTYRDNDQVIRIISARTANRREQRGYYTNVGG